MIYSASEAFQSFIKSKHTNLTFTEKKKAQILVTGQYQKADYASPHQYIVVPFTGLNGLDIPFIKAKGIHVFNTQAHSRYVAERALALLLTLMGKIIPFHQGLSQGHWAHRNQVNRTSWVSLFEKNVGFFGYGAINQHLHGLLKPFQIKAHTIDRGKAYQDVSLVKDVKALIKASEIIVIAAPLHETTEGIFNADLLKMMADKIIINVGRGRIIDEEALYHALRDQTLKGFASDVWFQYPKDDESLLPSKYPLESFSDVVITPHNGGFTDNAMDDRFEDLYTQIQEILNGDLHRALDI